MAGLLLGGCVTDRQRAGAAAIAESGRALPPGAARLGAPATFVVSPSPVPEWTDVLARHRQAVAPGRAVPASWTLMVERLQGLDLRAKLEAANEAINRYPYVPSERNWGHSGRWELPFELMARGGQCQDFAVAKYLLLRTAGVPADRLQVVLVHDGRAGQAHAVLLAEVDGETLALDNQEVAVTPVARLRHYRPLYALAENGWWLYDGAAPRQVLPAAGFDRASFGRAS